MEVSPNKSITSQRLHQLSTRLPTHGTFPLQRQETKTPAGTVPMPWDFNQHRLSPHCFSRPLWKANATPSQALSSSWDGGTNWTDSWALWRLTRIHSSPRDYHPQDMGLCFLWSWSVLIPVTSEIHSDLGLDWHVNRIKSRVKSLSLSKMTSQHRDILYSILAIGLLQDYHFLKWIPDLEVSFPPHSKRSRNLKCPGLPDLIPLHTIILCLSAHRGKGPSGLGFPSPSENELGKNKPLSFN